MRFSIHHIDYDYGFRLLPMTDFGSILFSGCGFAFGQYSKRQILIEYTRLIFNTSNIHF